MDSSNGTISNDLVRVFDGDRKKKRFPQRFHAFLIALLILSSSGAFYYFVYISGKKTDFNEKRFRSLSSLTHNLNSRYQEIIEIGFYSSDDSKKDANVIRLLKKDVKKELKSNMNLFFSSSEEKCDPNCNSTDVTQIELLTLEELFESIIPTALFQHFIILKKDEIVYNNLPNGIKDLPLDNEGLITSKIENFKISGSDYKAYYHYFDFEAIRNFLLEKNGNPKGFGPYLGENEDIIKQSIAGDWTIIGLVDNSVFRNEVTQVSIWFIVILTIVIAIVLACLPILKLIFAGEIELITVRDAFLSIMSVIIGTPLILVVFLAFFSYLDFYFYSSQKELEHYNSKISENFIREVGDVTKQLDVFVEYFTNPHESPTKTTWVLMERENSGVDIKKLAEKNSGEKPKRLQNVDLQVDYWGFNEATMVNDTGTQIYQFITDTNYDQDFIELRDRLYWQKAISNDLWKTDEENIVYDKLYIQSLVSWLTGKREAVISTLEDTREDTVLVITSKLASVFNTNLPYPYQFAIIDHEGKVLFHSIEQRNSNENFLDEIDNPQLIRSSIDTRKNASFTTSYWGKRIRGYVRPLSSWPLYVITYEELDSQRLFISNVMSTTLILFLIGMAALGGISIVTSAMEKKNFKFLRFENFSFYWLRPRKAYTQAYVEMILFFGCVIIYQVINLLVIEQSYKVFPSNYSLQIILPSFLFFIVHWITQIKRKSRKHYLYGEWKKYTVYIQILYLMILVSLILIWFRTSDSITESKNWVEIWAFISIAISLVIAIHYLGKTSIGRSIFTIKTNYVTVYRWFAMCWIAAAFLLPVIQIYVKSHSEERVLWTRYSQLKLAEGFIKKLEAITIETKKENSNEYRFGNKFREEKLTEYTVIEERESLIENEKTNFGVKDLPKVLDTKVLDTFDSLPSKGAIGLRNFFTPLYGESSHYLTKLSYDSKSNEIIWKENESIQSLIYPFDPNNEERGHIQINATTDYRFLKRERPKLVLLFLGLLILVLLLFNYLLRTIIHSLYGFKFADVRNILHEEDNLGQFIKKNPGPIVLIVNAGFDLNKLKWIKDSNSRWINLSLSEGEIIKTIQELKQETPKYILSHYYPSRIIDDFYRTLQKNENEKAIYDLITLFGTYPQYLVGYEIVPNKVKGDEILNNRFSDELDLSYVHKIESIHDEIKVLQNESLAYSYHMHLWDSLSKEEKYVLYDLSVDGFLNTKSSNIISTLIFKGILYWRDRLRIFSTAFRHFIRTTIVREQGKLIESEIGQKSSWNSLRIVIYMLVIGALFFIYLSEPDFFKDFNSFIAVIASIVTILPGLTTLIMGKKED